ncbi:transcriptional regulator [Enterobacter sp. SLBN-59]|uniref:transcriptional regulator n=1 Tax=Enterobacter sp. SLBN-59 TaxID=2940621 RepID=UPI00216A033F|nr:transcriptional regulator [Enterobacter sp. SLBN-59]MCS3490688.1 formate hydrogenlyase regulatory protein HycA [Enterobacter sp. SLBN-59]
MDIWILSEKAKYIANKRESLLKQWQQYSNMLTQGITLSKANLYHTISCTPDDGLRFRLFDYFVIHIGLADGFNNHTIEYIIEQHHESNKTLFASALIGEGRIDNSIDISNRGQVLKHYLGLIHPVYDRIYQSIVYQTIDENRPLFQMQSQRTVEK